MNPRDLSYIYDKPVQYKEITIYPTTMRDYYPFQYYSDALLLENDEKPTQERLDELKMSMLDYRKTILSMTYLEYLYFSATKENGLLSKLHGLLCLSLKRDLELEKDVWYGYEETNNKRGILKLDGIIYSGQDFDEIRLIISEYNLVKLPNMNVQKEIRDNIKLSKQLRAVANKTAGMEDLIVSLCSETGFEFEYVYDMTIRKFSKMLERVDNKLHYLMFSQASLSGMIEFKDKTFIKHWLSDLTVNELDEELIPIESVKDKISMNDLKK